ncbi:MAG: hypothetical protein J7M25_01640 [Deltaproteobacteria bacterium]|nr:hypothetical protein [Deltaproteobacteria bacterium]
MKMIKVTVVGPQDRQTWCVDKLQDLGVLHVLPLREDIPEPTELTTRLATVRRVHLNLTRIKPDKSAKSTDKRFHDLSADEIVDRAEQAQARLADMENKRSALHKAAEQAALWGDTTKTDLENLAHQGVHVAIYMVKKKVLPDIDLSHVPFHEVLGPSPRSGQLALAVMTLDEPAHLDLERIHPIDFSQAEVKRQLDEFDENIAKERATLADLARLADRLTKLEKKLEDQIAFTRAANAARNDEGLFALQGWAPVEELDHLRKELLPEVALLVADPDKDEEPPVELKNGPIARVFEPLVKMFDLPHYGEDDSTILIAPFMGLFFGLCLGDAGYGLVLLLAASMADWKLTLKGDGLKAVRFMELLGGVTIAVGLLTGQFFGIQFSAHPAFLAHFGLHRKDLFFTLSQHPANFFYFSLMLGVVQLSFGLLIKIIRQVRMEQYQASLATVGWLAAIPSLAVWYQLHSPYAFLGAAGLILLFSTPYKGPLMRLGGGAWALYGITGLFGDVMSYARIFGLGLSSGIIASVVNTLAGMAAHSGIAGMVGAALILVAGHSFNFAMAVVGALVHPARLQFLEFYGKFFEGGGKPYRPLRRLEP